MPTLTERKAPVSAFGYSVAIRPGVGPCERDTR